MLILIAHGSHDPRWRASVERLTQSLQAELGEDKVRLAYMECTPPTLMEVATEAAETGARTVRVLPLFLTGEGHVERDIDPLIEEVRSAHGSLHVELLQPVGQHPLFRKLLHDIALQTDE